MLTQKKPTGMLRAFLRLPISLYRFGLGWMLGNRFLLLTHTGRRSGLSRQVVLEVVDYEKETGVFYVAAAWREKADWYLNILKNPRVKLQVGNRHFEADAGPISGAEAQKILWAYARRHPAAFRELTLVMLGERLPPSYETCGRLAESVPVIALKPVK